MCTLTDVFNNIYDFESVTIYACVIYMLLLVSPRPRQKFLVATEIREKS